MTSRMRLTRDYPHDVAAFARALADPEFHRARLDVGDGGEVTDHRVEESGAAVVVTVRQPVPAGQVPAAIERLLRGRLELRRTERWRLGEKRCTGTVEVEVPRAPVRAGGSMEVTAVEGGSRLSIEVAATVTVPMAGAFVEPSVIEGIKALTGSEHEQIARWLSRHATAEGT